MTRKHVSFCGYRCDLCPAHVRNVDKLADSTTIREGWKTFFGFDVSEDHIKCVGCNKDGFHLDTDCAVRPCAIEKHVRNCSFCGLFESCDTLRSRADILDEPKKKFTGKISKKEYKLFFRPYEGRNELKKTKKKKGHIMVYKKKSWQEKLTDRNNLPKILKLQKTFPCYNAVHKLGAEVGDDVVLVNPSDVIALMKQVPKGKLITIVEICMTLASKHKVKGCCSLTTGIFIMTAANAVEEATEEGKQLKIPYWRTLKVNGELNEKYPGGAVTQKKLLEQEGFTVVKKGKKFVVKDFDRYVIEVKR